MDDKLKYFENLAKSLTWNSTLGLFGLDNPDEDVQEWEAENPKAAFISQVAPLAAGTAKAASMLAKGTRYGKWARGLASVENTAKAPFLSRLGSEAALLAPIEVGRQAIGLGLQTANPEWEGGSLGERATEALVDIGAGGVLAGGLGWIASGGKRIRVPKQFADISSKNSWQQNLRNARAKIGTVEPELEGELNNTILGLERRIREESRDYMIGELEGSEKWKALNSVLRGTNSVRSRAFSPNKEIGFKSLSELERTVGELKGNGTLTEDWLEYVQFPRLVSAQGKKAITRLDNTIQGNLAEVGNGWRLGKEKDGLYVIARKTGKEGNWFVAKTDDPAHFIPEQGNLLKISNSDAWRDPETVYKGIGDSDAVLDRALRFSDTLGDGTDIPSLAEAKGFQGAKNIARKLGWGAVEDSELLGNVASFAKRNFYPTAFKFKNSPLARKIYAVAQNTRDNARRKAQELVYGRPQVGEDSLLKVVSGGIKRDDPRAFANMVRQLATKNPQGFDTLLKIIDDEIPFSDVLIRPELVNALGADGLDTLRALNTLHDKAIQELTTSAGKLHIPDAKMFPLRKGHYGISHYWQGSLRQAILNDKGNLVYIVSGDNKKAVQKMAKGVIDKAKENGGNWRLGEFWMKDRALDLRQEKLLSGTDDFALANNFAAQYAGAHPDVAKSSFFFPRSGVGGYNRARTAEDLIENLSYSLENKYIWLANEINDRVLAKDIATLGIDDPRTAVMLQDTLSVLKGEQGVFSQLVNKTTDSILAPVLGTDSASRIVRSINAASAHLDLGFGNLAYALANILQPITTVLPQLALLRECPQALQWAYDGVPLIAKSGRGMVANTLSPLKIMWESLKLMGNPKVEQGFSEFMEQMVRDGALSPRFIESYIGENSGLGQGLADSLKKGDYSGMLRNMATMLPTFSEQASRGYAMTVGYKLFNSMAKAGMITKEQVYLGAKKFTENTMFQFAASDRARVLQGPVGQAWGLFKNWTMHYVGWQMQYLDAGLRYGAWKPYMYSNLATSLLGGMGSSEIGATLERFTEWAADDKMSNLLYDRWGNGTESNFLLYGIPGAFGFSLQSQVNSPFRDPGEETQRFMGFVWGQRFKALWNGLDSGIDYYATTGRNPAGDKGFQQGMMRALSPKMLYRTTQVVNDTLYASTGTKIADLTPLESLAYQYFNITPTRVDQAFKISNEIWRDKDKRAKLTQSYAEVFTNALESGDGRLMFTIVQRALLDGVDVGNMVNSAQTRIENRQLTPLQRNVDYYRVWGTTAGELGL